MMTLTYVPNKERKERIAFLLKNFPDIESKRLVLQQQIIDFNEIPREDVIEMLTFASSLSEKVQTGKISNPTQEIALKFEKVARKESVEAFMMMVNRYNEMTSELKMLRFCVELLSGELPQLIDDMCYQAVPRKELCIKYKLTHATLYRRFQKAVSDIDWLLSSRL